MHREGCIGVGPGLGIIIFVGPVVGNLRRRNRHIAVFACRRIAQLGTKIHGKSRGLGVGSQSLGIKLAAVCCVFRIRTVVFVHIFQQGDIVPLLPFEAVAIHVIT